MGHHRSFVAYASIASTPKTGNRILYRWRFHLHILFPPSRSYPQPHQLHPHPPRMTKLSYPPYLFSQHSGACFSAAAHSLALSHMLSCVNATELPGHRLHHYRHTHMHRENAQTQECESASVGGFLDIFSQTFFGWIIGQ